jgi:NADH dehydrogenase
VASLAGSEELAFRWLTLRDVNAGCEVRKRCRSYFMAKRIVVLGGGFGGMQVTLELEKNLRNNRDAEIVLVSEQNYFLFTPLLPQIASSNINPRHIVQTVRDMRGTRRFGFRRDTVTAVDLASRRIVLAGDALDYDVLVVALGSRSDYFRIPGAAEHTWNFKSLEDAVVLREHVLDMCEHADHTTDPATRRAMLTFVIVGGGYTGVELIAELRDLLFGYVTRRYRGIAALDIRLLLLEATPEILRGIAPRLKAHAMARLSREGIEVRTGARVTRCTPDDVQINNTETIASWTVVWSAGVRAHALVEALPGQHDRVGRLVVNQHLQLPGHPEVFVIGDNAAASTAPDAPLVAPVAISEGEVVAENIARYLRGAPMEEYRYRSQGMLVSLGMNYAVVSVGPLKFSGYFAWLFWNAVHLYKMVGLKKQFQIAMDWMLGTIFPRDTAIVRPPRGCRICETMYGNSYGNEGGNSGTNSQGEQP